MAKSRSRREAELHAKVTAQYVSAVGTVLSRGVKYGAFVWISAIWADAFKALVGHITLADIKIEVLQSLFQKSTAHEWIEYTLIVGLLLWAILERRLRGRTVERLQGRIQTLEKRLDPQRTSSLLTTTGETNPKDIP